MSLQVYMYYGSIDVNFYAWHYRYCEILLRCCGIISANGRSKQGPVVAAGTSRVQGVTSVTLSSQWWCHKSVRAQEHRQEARHHHTSQPSQRRCSQDCSLRQIPLNVAGKPRGCREKISAVR